MRDVCVRDLCVCETCVCSAGVCSAGVCSAGVLELVLNLPDEHLELDLAHLVTEPPYEIVHEITMDGPKVVERRD